MISSATQQVCLLLPFFDDEVAPSCYIQKSARVLCGFDVMWSSVLSPPLPLATATELVMLYLPTDHTPPLSPPPAH